MLCFCQCIFLFFNYGKNSLYTLIFLHVKKTHLFSYWFPQSICAHVSMCECVCVHIEREKHTEGERGRERDGVGERGERKGEKLSKKCSKLVEV